MDQHNSSEVLATIEASAPRRWLAISMLGLLGLMLIYFGFVLPPANLLLQLFVIGLGALSLALAVKMHGATASEIQLTREGLRDRNGTQIARLEDIRRVNRGAFAFKPSNGFMIQLSTSQGRAWRPGLWWRFGRRVGVGGVTPGNQAKVMAEMIQTMITERDAL